MKQLKDSSRYFAVKAVALDRRTRRQLAPARVEIVDTKRNILFQGNTPLAVERDYEAFWALDKYSPEVVKVIDVRPYKKPKRGYKGRVM